jgi:hypothetical protein
MQPPLQPIEIQVDGATFRQNKLFVATPMYGYNANGVYVKSLLNLQAKAHELGIGIEFSFVGNESLITRARNYLTELFLQSDCTHLLFIDSDIGFAAEDVITLLALDKDIIGGPYPRKSINWKNVHTAARKNPTMNPKELENFVGEYVFNTLDGTTSFKVLEPLDVLEIGTGHMLIKRHVFEQMKAAYPTLRYRHDYVNVPKLENTPYLHAFFDTIIDTADSPTGGGTERYLSEDYTFCQLWRKLGGKIYLCPWMKLQHVGTYIFAGDISLIADPAGFVTI